MAPESTLEYSSGIAKLADTAKPARTALAPKAKKSNLAPKQKKTYSSFKDWGKDSKTSNPVPLFFHNSIGKHRYFSACTESKELYKVKITYDKLNTHHGFINATLSLQTVINGTEDHYLFHVTVSLDQDQCWRPKPNGFKVCVHNDNTHEFADTMLTFLKSPASKFKGNVRKYLYGDKMQNTDERHKNMMGCLLKNGFSQFYSASTQQKNAN